MSTNEFHRRFAHDPLIGPTVQRLRGMRTRRKATVAHAVVRAISGQLIQAVPLACAFLNFSRDVFGGTFDLALRFERIFIGCSSGLSHRQPGSDTAIVPFMSNLAGFRRHQNG